ncbi:sodium:alanine symporter family protein [Thomasclavelia sp.]|uniref:alanine/glycine:cation symporter family protein n=1 Tax=Thomasclavelia sp. TaxID=3025757 RepID=UPI0025F4150D|nr:sodium:alanine symporter family protein [Thomasclavelia sp.]
MVEILTKINEVIWGLPLIGMLLATGVCFTVKLKLVQIRKLKLAFACIFKKDENDEGDVSSFQALCTALSSTIGTGNIVGVATAIAAGGPGALFWMWISAFFGMATKYSEGLLAIRYRIKDENGEIAGGPMYYLENGLKSKLLAKIFAFFAVAVALLGIGTFTQVKSISDALQISFNIPPVVTAILLTVSVGFITIGGIKRISIVAEKVIPMMCVFYVSGVVLILLTHLTILPQTIALIIEEAFSLSAMFGGGAGVTMMMAMQKGISRGIFSNESGLGSAPIAAAAAKTDSCVEQGLVSMTGTFIDTIVICTMTGLAIIITNSHTSGLAGAAMTTLAFDQGLFIPVIGKYIVNIGLVFFAFTTIIGWNYYGERAIYYLKGLKAIKYYKLLFIVFIAIGPFLSIDAIFILADIVNGCMAFPNLIGLIGLRKEIITLTQEYFRKEAVMDELVID